MFLKNLRKFKRDLFGDSQERQKEYPGSDPGDGSRGRTLKLEKISFNCFSRARPKTVYILSYADQKNSLKFSYL